MAKVFEYRCNSCKRKMMLTEKQSNISCVCGGKWINIDLIKNFVSCKCGTPLELEEYEFFSCPLCKKIYYVELTEIIGD